MSEANWRWFLNADNGLAYGTDGAGEAGEVEIPSPPPGYVDFKWTGKAWVAKTPADREAEEDASADDVLNADRMFNTLVVWLSEKVEIPLEQARAELKAIYKTLG